MNAVSSSPSSSTRDNSVADALGLWEPKRTLTLEAARRHTQRIQTLRKVLIGLAGLLVLFLIFQFVGSGTKTFDDPNPTESVKMVNPRYSGRTSDGLPFYLTADTATRKMANRTEVALVKPVLEFIRADEAASSFVLADTGTYDDVKKILNLRTDVNLETDDGYICDTTHARIFARDKRLEGDEPIACAGNFGTVNGRAFEINDNYKEFVFKDGMDAVISQDPAKSQSISQEGSSPDSQSSFAFGGDGPIDITADRAVYIGGQTDLFGDVVVTQDGATIYSDTMNIFRSEATSEADGSLQLGEVNKIIATDNFRYKTAENDVTGNRGVYERDKNLITVTGDVLVKQPGGNTAKTDKLTYNTITETIRFSGNCQGRDCGPGGRTRVVIQNGN
ncbi:LPS export ABC transporter periplasmic protein LptC [Litorimonas sp.]|jgi:lipopolysaccharide transport protein LptA|uniref:LPS export ABC transporter periplasmic protein LptC n=1 Tax=Litorimonas sp. TaxID=1892381 RepID=UPI003A85F3E7